MCTKQRFIILGIGMVIIAAAAAVRPVRVYAQAPADPYPILIEVKYPKGEYEDPASRSNGYVWVAPVAILQFGCFPQKTASTDDAFALAITQKAVGDGRAGGTTDQNEVVGGHNIAVWGSGGGGGGWMAQQLGTDAAPVCNETNPYLTVRAMPEDGVSFIPQEVQTVLAPKGQQTKVLVEVRHPIIIKPIVDISGKDTDIYGAYYYNNNRVFMRMDGHDAHPLWLVHDDNSNKSLGLVFSAANGLHTIQIYINRYWPMNLKVDVDYKKGPTIMAMVGDSGIGKPDTIPPGSTDIPGFKPFDPKFYDGMFQRVADEGKNAAEYLRHNLSAIQKSNGDYSGICQQYGLVVPGTDKLETYYIASEERNVPNYWHGIKVSYARKVVYPTGCGEDIQCPQGQTAIVELHECSSSDGMGYNQYSRKLTCVPWKERSTDEYFAFGDDVQHQVALEEASDRSGLYPHMGPYCSHYQSLCGNGKVETDRGEQCDPNDPSWKGNEKDEKKDQYCSGECKIITKPFIALSPETPSLDYKLHVLVKHVPIDAAVDPQSVGYDQLCSSFASDKSSDDTSDTSSSTQPTNAPSCLVASWQPLTIDDLSVGDKLLSTVPLIVEEPKDESKDKESQTKDAVMPSAYLNTQELKGTLYVYGRNFTLLAKQEIQFQDHDKEKSIVRQWVSALASAAKPWMIVMHHLAQHYL